MSDPTKAVFLSYARDDAAAARRIAEALRASGLEVWFDENELRGGDAWDAKIRQQIDACALFLAVISSHTQERSKGYFRLEWKLAVDQTHLLAAGVPFIAPVVVDDTPEGGALVPPEFMRVQWMRLPGALPTPQFVEQVNRLLRGKPVAGVADPGRRVAEPGSPTPATKKSASLAAVWISLGVVAVSVGVVFFITGRRESTEEAARRSAPPTPAAPDPKSQTPDPIRSPAALAKSIAVLPFANLSADADNAFFADGMHDDLITALAKIRDLKVISRTSVMPYKTGERNLRKIAAELGVATVLEGSVQRAGNKVRLNVQLIDARTDGHLWAETYSKDITDVFAMQAALTQEIAGALKASLTAGERTLIERRPTQDQQAYDLYLRARLLDQNLVQGASRVEYERVIGLYEQAAAKDPAFALPHVQASILHGSMYWFAALDPTPARRARAQAEVEAAQRLAPGSPETQLARGSFEYTCNNDWKQALAEYRAAEAGLPNDAQLHFRIGLAHRRLGQLTEALDRFERSTALNPNALSEVATQVDTVLALRRYGQVVELCAKYEALSAAETELVRHRIRARYELDGDRAAYLKTLAGLPADRNDTHGLDAAYNAALRAGDLAAAERVLADPRLTVVIGGGGAISEPVSLHRALVAWLRGQPDDARRFADEAIGVFRHQKWAPRQAAWVRMGIARADALAGRVDEALRGARLALDEQTARDVYAATVMNGEYGHVLLICQHRDKALALLRELLAQPSQTTPREIRFDPIWSRLKDDPRFEEILRAAKPL